MKTARPLRIGLNALFLIPSRVGGTETYVRYLLQALARQDSESRFLVFVNESARGTVCPSAPNFQEVCCPFPGENRLERVLWEQFVLPWQCRTYGLDLLHSLGSTGPIRLPVPSVVTMHDIQYYHYPTYFGTLRRRYLQWVTPRVVRRAFRTVTVSEHTRQEVIRYLGVPDPRRIIPIHSGADHFPTPDPRTDHEADACPVLQGYGISSPYLLSLAMSFPHKNLERLLQAFHRLIKRPETDRLFLVLTGQTGPGHASLVKAVQQLDLVERVHLTGYVAQAEVLHFLRHCRFFVFPSLYEGFGFPVLEAMSQGVPVLSSSGSSLPELVGDGAVLFDPRSIEALEQAMILYLNNPALRAAMVRRGFEQVKRFRWDDTARQVLTVYGDVAGLARPSA